MDNNIIKLVAAIVVFYALVLLIYSLASNNKMASGIPIFIKSKLKSYWRSNESDILSFAEFSEIFIVPILITFATFLVFTRIEFLGQYSKDGNDLFLLLVGDIVLNPSVYAFFAGALVFWFIVKALSDRKKLREQSRERAKDRDELTKALDKMNTTLESIDNRLGNIEKKVGKNE